MKKTLLVSLAMLAGVVSAASAASIPGRIDGDLYFDDSVHISSGVSYQESLDNGVGTSSVEFGGEGSLTIGKRLGKGFPRVVFYGGTTLTVEQNFGESAPDWWIGEVVSPNQILNIPRDLVSWENESNHNQNGGSAEGEIKILQSFGFGSSADTYKFSSSAYIVLPVDAPNGAKVWYAFHDIDTKNCNASSCLDGGTEMKIGENDFCVIQDNLCIVEIDSLNQISLVEESFEKCPRAAVANGDVGVIPYCVITCDSGYEMDENFVACVEVNSSENTTAGDVIEEVQEIKEVQEKVHSAASSSDFGFEGLQGEDLKVALERARLQGIGKFDYQSGHYTGDALQLIDTTHLSGDELRVALKRNAQINSRKGVKNTRVAEDPTIASALMNMIDNINQELWSKGNQGRETMLATDDEQGMELSLEENDSLIGMEESESFSMHSSAPFLPSTGSSTIFIIISILGIGLMMMAFKRR